MLILLEIGLAVWLVVVSRRVWGKSLAANVLGLARWCLATAVGTIAGWLVSQATSPAFSNFVLGYLVAGVAGVLVCCLVGEALRRWSRRAAWDQACTAALRLPVWVDRAASLLMLMAIWLGALAVVDLTARAEQIAAESKSPAERDGIPTVAAVRPTGDGAAAVHDAILLQDDFLRRFEKGVARSRQEFYDAVGAQDVLDQVHAVQQINSLTDEEKTWLLEQNPQIARLANHPALQRIVRNDALVANLERVGQGSLAAMYEIGEDPDFRELLDDPQVLQVAREIDPVVLMQQVKRHREETAAARAAK